MRRFPIHRRTPPWIEGAASSRNSAARLTPQLACEVLLEPVGFTHPFLS
ncbi:hypothetical protein [Dysosmobacter welbionis]|nr:hypothetical protein [Dysosmobacter welbionis]